MMAVVVRIIALSLCLLGFDAHAQQSGKTYLLGPGDLIQIQVYGEEDLTVKLRLEEDGLISYPFLGDIKVEGLPVEALEQRIYRGLKQGYLVNPDVRVFVLEYRAVYVNGQVRSPGGYPYVPGLTVQKAIALAGGMTDLASKRGLKIIREGNDSSPEESVDLDSPMGPGDILVVEERFF